MKNILVITDLSQQSEAAAEPALALASALDTGEAKLTLLHVTELASDVQTSAPHTATLDDYKKKVRRLAHARLKELQVKLFGDRPFVRHELVDGKVVWKSICDYAEEHGADVIVMTTHGRSGVAHAMLGSVAERVVRAATCPVLTVRVPGAA